MIQSNGLAIRSAIDLPAIAAMGDPLLATLYYPNSDLIGPASILPLAVALCIIWLAGLTKWRAISLGAPIIFAILAFLTEAGPHGGRRFPDADDCVGYYILSLAACCFAMEVVRSGSKAAVFYGDVILFTMGWLLMLDAAVRFADLIGDTRELSLSWVVSAATAVWCVVFYMLTYRAARRGSRNESIGRLMSMLKLQPVRIEDETRLRCEFQLETTGRNSFCYPLVAKFTGEYRHGSAGRADAEFILGMTRLAAGIWHPAGLVLDLSELSYEWGDEMDRLLPPDVVCKAAIVAGPKCARAIATAMWGVHTQKLATDADFVFDSLEDAWQWVRHQDQ